MNTANSHHRPATGSFPIPPRSKSRGVALIIVLAMLVLMTVLVVGFFRRASVERMSASAYFESNRNSLFADQAVNIVQTQINHASTRPGVAWASQPGMVRTFNQNGALNQAYKLYSDTNMVTGSISVQSATDALAGWNDSPAHFVDLNAPVNGVYPILDPLAVGSGNGPAVEGFALGNNTPATSDQPVPMPVKWLYVLENGTVIAPTGGSGSSATFTAPDAPTAANPIVGRLAFWTDDETCKLNINTASHGTFWDIPRAFSLEERDRMARFQPAAREFQRYPGHPSTTSLKPVFPGLSDEEIYDLAPRVEPGGSLGGTQKPLTPVALDDHRLFSSIDELLFDPERATGSLTPDQLERAKFFLTARSNAPEVNLFNLPRMAIWPVNAGTKTPSVIDNLLAFCSTIDGKEYYFQRANPNSSTADMTAFNGRNATLHNYINRLLAQPPPGFGNTSFTGKYTQPETQQIVTQIFDYIRSSNLYSTSFGASAYTDGSGLDYAPRNDVPANAYPPVEGGSGVGQVVPLKVSNTKGFGRVPVISRAVFQLFASGAEMEVVNAGGVPQGRVNEFVPMRQGWRNSATRPNKTPKLKQDLNYATEGTNHPLYNSWKNFLDGKPPYTAANEYHGETATLLTSGIIYFDTFDPMYGYTAPKYNFDIRVKFSGPWAVSGKALNFPDSTLQVRRDHSLVYDARDDRLFRIWLGRQLGGPLLPQWIMQNYSSLRGNPTDPTDATRNGALQYPLVSDRIAIHPPITLVNKGTGVTTADRDFPSYTNAGSAVFSGGSMTVELVVGTEVVQTYEFEFPAFTKNLPGYDGVDSPLQPNSPQRNRLQQMPVSFDFRHRWLAQPHVFKQMNSGDDTYNFADLRLVQPFDIAVSLVPKFGDKRLLAAKSSLGMSDFQPHELYETSSARAAIDFRDESANTTSALSSAPGTLSQSQLLNVQYGRNARPDIPSHLNPGVQQGLNLAFPPDFDNGTFHMPDDAYVNRADESSAKDATQTDARHVAWYEILGNIDDVEYREVRDTETFYSPNRQMPSAAMFGSLPTGVKRNLPWQTLLFRPDPGNHPGAANPPDHTLLDLFWMPVVEPYAISEPFSTNGKVNMNHQIMPFGGYITRATALHGVLKTEEMLVLENSHGYNAGNYSQDEYKAFARSNSNAQYSSIQFRKKVDAEETLKAFQAVFDDNRIFRSETEICSLPLIPEGQTYSSNFETSYWNSRRLTGDNSRERPYVHLLPRLTTRSNTFTIHMTVQSLKKVPGTSVAVWDEDRDQVTAEYRGSRTIERYIDPNTNTPIPDYAASNAPFSEPALDQFYRWRVIANREFQP